MHPSAGHGASQPQWDQNNSSSVVPQIANASDSYRGFINDSIHSVDVPVQNPNFEDHEMFSWLHFPVDENYCPDWIQDLSSSNVQIVKHSLNELGLQQGAAPFNGSGSGSVMNVLLNASSEYPEAGDGAVPVYQGTDRPVVAPSSALDEARTVVAGADAVMVMEEGVALSATYPSVDKLNPSAKLCGYGSCTNQVRMVSAEAHQQLSVDKRLQQLEPKTSVSKLSASESVPLISQSSYPGICPLNSNSSNQVMLKPPEPSFGKRNFAHFSSPVAETKANLQILGAASGPTGIERARQHNGQAAKMDLKHKDRSQLMLPPLPPVVVSSSAAQLPPLPLPASTTQDSETGKGKSVMDETFVNSYASSSGVTASNQIIHKQPTAEQTTATSPSRMSFSSSEKSGKETAFVMSKRKGCGIEDSECQSEDVDEASNSTKKSAKRSRAAELHNLCERKRRDKINEKLMALRELMPNSSKTAKASILDEAIEYVKLLQSQLQAWSSRTGICIPPTLMPNVGIHQLQMPGLPHLGLGMEVGMGVGFGMGMGIGMGLMDVNTAAVMPGRAVMPILPLPQPSVGGPSGGPQPCLPALGVMEAQPFNLYVPNQEQTASVSANMHRNMELYHVYMQGQQHQQQQQQQHHHHHQQQQQQQEQQQHQQQQQQEQQHQHQQQHHQQQWHPYPHHLQGNTDNRPTQ